MQRFEFVEGTSNKFWEVALAGTVLETRWGKIGGSVSSREAELGSPEAAAKERDRMIREKTGKGYREVGSAKPAKAAKANGTKPVTSGAKPVTSGAKPVMSGVKPVTSGVKPSELVLTQLRDGGRGGRLSRIAIDGHRILASGERTLASTDGKVFHSRTHPGTVFALHAFDGAFYSCGGPFSVTRDHGETWTEILFDLNDTHALDDTIVGPAYRLVE